MVKRTIKSVENEEFKPITNLSSIRNILTRLTNGNLSISEAESLISNNSLLSVDDFLLFDTFREGRSGIPEVIFSESKSNNMLIKIIENVTPKRNVVLFTRLTDDHLELFNTYFSKKKNFHSNIDYDGRTAVISLLNYKFPEQKLGPVVILTAGSSDIPIAKEAQLTLNLMGIKTLTSYDVGIAGLHRLINPLKIFLEQNPVCIIVCAGMEGALPSVVAGLVDVPVIGVPVSIGYGYGGKGIGALTSMLQSCSPGLSVVNIDAGFNAGAMAALIAKRIEKELKKK
ncbi:MAG: N5-carboxyaminoimidazole ribonucleotide mutase [Candidatus Heimdallarchaeota archaeon LC_3]|nr:MAG: N5-carboxyaminoimidazole ribonucleotide mutase [Candidatus Heimdallarchaeota archaeon LC_3]